MPAVDECEGGAASAADMIAMIGAGTVRPPPWMANGGRHEQVSAFGMKAVQRGAYSVHRGECRPSGCGRSARTSPMLGTKPSTGGVGGEWRPTWTSFRVRDENRPEGRLFGSWGQIRPTGLKTATGSRGGQVFMLGMKNLSGGASARFADGYGGCIHL